MTRLRLTVAIPTYRRAHLLAAGLPPVISQVRALTANPDVPVSADVLVVDNDADESARAVVRLLTAQDVQYVVEPTPGIVAARNRALDESLERDLLVFLDDDERPRAQWLEHLVRTYIASKPAAVMGRVVSDYDRAVADPWVAAGELFQRKHWPTGTLMDIAAAGNLLLDLRQLRALNVRFDTRLGMAGGEDSLMSRQLARSGGQIIFCYESVAVDYVVPERLTRRWLLQRAISQGNIKVRIEVLLAGSRSERLRARLYGIFRGLARVGGGAARAILGYVTGSLMHQARGARTMCRGLGMLSAAVGRHVEEYART